MIDYTPWNVTDFQQIFIQEAKLLIEIFRNEIVEIHHFGSSSVKDLPGNKTIDILPVVKNLNKIDGFKHKMNAIGYECIDSSAHTNENCRLYRASRNGITFIVMMVERTDFEAIDRRLAVRDYLRSNVEERQKYARYKARLASTFRNDFNEYQNKKRDYIAKLEQIAIDWYRINKS